MTMSGTMSRTRCCPDLFFGVPTTKMAPGRYYLPGSTCPGGGRSVKPEAELLFKCLSASIRDECIHGGVYTRKKGRHGGAYTIRSVQVDMEENTHKGKIQILKKI